MEWQSSNSPLYDEMNRRMYDVLATRMPQVEPDSIDEMFLDLAGSNLPEFCRKLRDDVRRVAKIPTCIGIEPTKTIANLDNRVAKDDLSLAGVCDLRQDEGLSEKYTMLPVRAVWGSGGKAAEELNTRWRQSL